MSGASGERTLSLTDRVGHGGRAVFARIDGQVVALDAARGVCYGLDDIGSRIWALIELPTTVAAVCEVLANEYAVDPAQCRSDVLHLMNAMADEGLLEVAA